MSDDIKTHLARMRAEDRTDARVAVTRFIVYLKMPGLWMGPRCHWAERQEDAQRFDTFEAADQASAGYDVIIRTVNV